MATPGRKPIPTHLKLVKGNPGKRDINKTEPKPPALDTKPAPDWFDDYARQEWDRRLEQLTRNKVITEVDDGALTALCVAWSRWRNAEDALALVAKASPTTRGLMIRTAAKKNKDGTDAGGGNMIQNPLVGTANKAMELYLKLAVEFGMTPSSRARVSTATDDKGNPFAKFGGAA